jgi:apolipoprotein N-acyltransferase
MAHASSLLWLAGGAALFGLLTRVAIPPAAWIALTLLVHASRSMPAWPGLPFLWVALYVALATGNRGILPVSGPAYFAIVAFTATTVAVPFALDLVVASRFSGFASTIIFPVAFVAAEFLRSRFTPASTWGSIAYTQYGNLPVMQVAAVVGLGGITFLVAWFASTFEWAWRLGFAWSVVRGPVLIYAAVLGAIVSGGAVRLALASGERSTLRVATLNRPVDLFVPGEMTRIAEGRLQSDEAARVAEKLTRLQDWFVEGSRREARAGARLIVWPESNLLISGEDETAFVERAQRLAADERIYLAMGMGTVHRGTTPPFENKMVLIERSGRIAVSYLKSHAVPGWEAGIMRPGDGRLPVISTEDGRIAAAICFDADFPEFIRQAARGAADLLIVPANDWREVKDIHSQMAAFRAIENGLPLVRATASGLSSAFDPWGRVLAVTDYFAASDGTMIAQVPMGRIPTLYARTGDLFAWLCVAGLAGLLALTAAILIGAVAPGQLDAAATSHRLSSRPAVAASRSGDSPSGQGASLGGLR